MEIRNKSIATFFLLVLALAPLFYSFSYQSRQQQIRRRMKEQLEEKMLHSITLKQAEIRWVRPGKEIFAANRMFDVKRIEYHRNGTVTFTGLFDEEETALVDQLRQQQKNESGSSRQLAQYFQVLLALPSALPDNNPVITQPAPQRFPHRATELLSAVRTILTPPPQA